MHVAINDVDKVFGGTRVLAGCTLGLERGEVVSLLGPSGCGKTTLLRCLAGFLVPERGEIRIDDVEVTLVPANRRRVGLVFQNYALFPHLSVFDNVAYGLTVRRRPRGEITRRVREALALVALEEFADRFPAQLSGGQQQRVALARAFILEPEILLLDEPFNALDAKLRGTMQIELRKLVKRLGMTSIFVTHDQTEALTLSDRVAVMRDGVIEQLDHPLALYDAPASGYVAGFIGTTNFGRREAGGGQVAVGRGLALPTAAHGHVQVVLRPENLHVRALSDDLAAPFVGTVTFVRPLGATVEYEIDAGADGTLRVVDLREALARTFAEGDDVAVAVRKPEACTILPLEPAR
jgi:ABC-type Fe3+/spermidine/putrescine transport system ATPase subunit